MSYEQELIDAFCKKYGHTSEDFKDEKVYKKFLHFGWWEFKRDDNEGELHAEQIEQMNCEGAEVRKIGWIDGADECIIGTADIGSCNVACYSLASLVDKYVDMNGDEHNQENNIQAIQDVLEIGVRQCDNDPIIVDDI